MWERERLQVRLRSVVDAGSGLDVVVSVVAVAGAVAV